MITFFFNFRFNFYDITDGQKLFEIARLFTPAQRTINSGFSVLHKFTKTDDLLKNMSSNHRYYYKKSTKNDLSITFESSNKIEEFIKLHNEMTLLKSLSLLTINQKDIESLADDFSDNFLIASVYFEDQVVASCLILIFEDYAFYYLAASNEIGRKTFASYYMIKELFEYFTTQSITTFDFAGITPYDNSASGVNKFKIGFGGEIVNYIGEQELSSNKFVKTVFNKMVKYI